jgi:SAM-dependent methyltransferase
MTGTALDTACLGCGFPGLELILSLGDMPLANALLTRAQLGEPEPRYPLELALCPSCALVQITEQIDSELLFGEYAYFSSYSMTMLEHARVLVDRMIEERNLDQTNLVVEIASNDGYLLQYYVAAGVPVLGIEPARNVARVAEERGIETLCEFFGSPLAEDLRAAGRRPAVLHANNVLAHVPSVNDVVGGIGRVLSSEGVAVIETPYVRDLIERLEFDTIYHEHLFYYSLTALQSLMERNGVCIFEVERIPIHGGSLRVFAAPAESAPAVAPSVESLLQEEAELGLATAEYFRSFASRVDELRRQLLDLLDDLSACGHRVAAYGAAAKGTVLLNACGFDADRITFVADRSDYKQGRFMPGVHIPIVAPDRLLTDMPDEVLLLTWNFADEILDQQAEYRRRGGRFIIPTPSPKLV